MTLPGLVTVEQLATWLNVTISEDDARALGVIDAASGLVRATAGRTWVDDVGDLVENIPSVATTVTLTAAARAWLNPAGASDQRTGPYGASWANGASGVMLTSDEREMLAGLTGVPGISSIRVQAPARASASRWLGWPLYSESVDEE